MLAFGRCNIISLRKPKISKVAVIQKNDSPGSSHMNDKG